MRSAGRRSERAAALRALDERRRFVPGGRDREIRHFLFLPCSKTLCATGMIGASFDRKPSPLAVAEAAVEWRVSPGLTPYPEALAEMEARAAAIRAGEAPELVWLLEHPPLYTAGTSADPAELFNPDGLAGLCRRPRRALHLSRARPARRLCAARSRATGPRRPPIRPCARRLGDRDARRARRRRPAGARTDRHLGRSRRAARPRSARSASASAGG